jgi:hypothetical protein
MNIANKSSSSLILIFLIKYFFLILQIFQYNFFIGLRSIPSNNKLIKYKISLKILSYIFYLMKIKYKIKLANITKIFIKYLNKTMNQF